MNRLYNLRYWQHYSKSN